MRRMRKPRQRRSWEVRARPSRPTSPASGRLPDLMKTSRVNATATPAEIIRNCRLSIGRPACAMRVARSGPLRFDFFSRSLRLSEICFFFAARSATAALAFSSDFCTEARRTSARELPPAKTNASPPRAKIAKPAAKNRVVDHRSALASNATAPRGSPTRRARPPAAALRRSIARDPRNAAGRRRSSGAGPGACPARLRRECRRRTGPG